MTLLKLLHYGSFIISSTCSIVLISVILISLSTDFSTSFLFIFVQPVNYLLSNRKRVSRLSKTLNGLFAHFPYRASIFREICHPLLSLLLYLQPFNNSSQVIFNTYSSPHLIPLYLNIDTSFPKCTDFFKI